MLSKVHHAAIDGVSGVDMMNALHTMTADGDTTLPPDNWRPEADPSQIGLFARGYARSLLNPIRQPHRMFDAKTFKMKDVKRLRVLAKGAKLNDVILSVVGGAMRQYLDHYDELPDSSVTTMAPISVRDDSEKNTMGNQVAAMFVPLGSHIPSAQERMKYVTEETIKAKTFTNALGARQMTEMAKLTPAPVMNFGAMAFSRLKLADHMKPFVNTVVTNVPGPPVPIYSAGAKLIGLHGMLCLVDGVKLGHVVHSYVNDVTVGFTACRKTQNDDT